MKEQNKLRRAMDAMLPGVQDAAFEQRVLRRVHAPVTHRAVPKRKVVLILAALAVLLSATALAAVLLGARELVEDYALPMSDATAGDAYTAAQTEALVALAEENGILLSESTRERIDRLLSAGEGEYKEELLMAIAKAEFGEQPAAWTLEQQNWFDDVCVAIGFIPQKEKAMPDKGEDAFAWAAAVAAEHIRVFYGETADLTDPAVYAPVGVQYLNGDAESPGMVYSVTFQPREGTEAALHAREYWVYLNDAGEVLGQEQRYFLTDAYRNAYGDTYADWPQSALRAFREEVLAQEPNADNMKEILCMQRTTYPDIAADALTRSAACDIAAAYAGVSADACTDSVYIGHEPNPVWKVALRVGEADYTVEVDSLTGEVLTCMPVAHRWLIWRGLFLEDTKEDVQEAYDEYIESTASFG